METTGDSIRVRLALVARSDASSAIIGDLLVTRLPLTRERLQWNGPVRVSDNTRHHLEKVILPNVEKVEKQLGLSPCSFRLEPVNLSAASSRDASISIDGYSADVPVLVGLLGTLLGISPREDIVATGHIATQAGDIRLVRRVDAKLKAAVDAKLDTLIYPDPEYDGSHATWFAEESDSLRVALKRFRGAIALQPARHIREVIPLAFSDMELVRASLRAGFFESDTAINEDLLGIVRLLSSGPDRMLALIRQYLHVGDVASIRTLLAEWAKYFIEQSRYPDGWGGKLLALLQQTPPAIVRLRLQSLLLDADMCVILCSLADDQQAADAARLFAFAKAQIDPNSVSEKVDSIEQNVQVAVQQTVAALRHAHLTEMIDRPIHEARAAFSMPATKAQDEAEFQDTVRAFYYHVLSHLNETTADAVPELLLTEALKLLDRVFSRDGGMALASRDALSGAHCGLAGVLDRLTKAMIVQRREARIRLVLAMAVDLSNEHERKAYASALLTYGRDILPEEFAEYPLIHWANHLEQLLDAFLDAEYQTQLAFRASSLRP